jgi:hypothetical protein
MFDYNELQRKIVNNEPFSTSRWGDGEWNAIMGKNGRNCDGHEYYKDMGERLRKILDSRPEYYLGLQSLALKWKDHQRFKDLYQRNKWELDNEIFTRLNRQNKMLDFMDLLETKIKKDVRIMVIGNHSIYRVPFTYSSFVHIPEVNCWLVYKQVKSEIQQYVEEYKSNLIIILYCASMMSNVLIDDFYPYKNLIQIDIGSAFDPWVGVKSRTYMQEL